MNDLLYKIGITLIPGVGCVTAKQLIAYCGGVEGVFRERKSALKKIPGVGPKLVNAIINHDVFERAEQEIEFINKNDIKVSYYLDKDYPSRLKNCSDSPILLFHKGNTFENHEHVLAVVGTRNATEYGKSICKEIIKDLAPYNPAIISGLAYGIDTQAHKSALDNKLTTYAILGHGLDMIYPGLNSNLAEKITNSGALVTEFFSETIPDRENFPKRNRIIAGMSDAVLVIEAGKKGGAIITAEIAFSYSRDVFAVPGKTNDTFSQGCNAIIKRNVAALVESASDIVNTLNWSIKKEKKTVQKELFVQLNEQEKQVFDYINNNENAGIDNIMADISMPLSVLSRLLLELELKGIVKCMPGKIYKINN